MPASGTLQSDKDGGPTRDRTRQQAAAAGGAEHAPLKLEHFLPYQLNVLASLVSQALSRVYARRYRIGVPEWRVLVTLGQFGVMTGKAIGAHTHMHKTKVSRAVALLEKRKLLARRVNRADMREVVSLAHRVRPRHLRGAGAACARLRPPAHRDPDPADRDAFNRAMQQTHRSLRAARRRERTSEDGAHGGRVKLYSYFRSSAAYRVRIALNLKGIAYEMAPIHLVKDGGHNTAGISRRQSADARAGAGHGRGDVLIQSLAIIEYLDETHPEPPLLPKIRSRAPRCARSRKLIACDIHPLNNVAPLRYLKNQMEPGAKRDRRLVPSLGNCRLRGVGGDDRPGPYACGAEVTLADICLVPQVYNARRLKVPMGKFPKIVGVDAACLELQAFDRARPENQPDAE